MEKPLIILGAGASYDFVHADLRESATPPLTDQLVDRGRISYDITQKYPEVEELFSRVFTMLKRPANKKTFEEAVQKVGNHAQISALRFYLSEYFTKISFDPDLRRQRLNNYKSLVTLINAAMDKNTIDEVGIITFNYDTLFDQHVAKPLVEMREYIEGPIKLFKVHGSCDWFSVHIRGSQEESGVKGAFNFLKSNASYKAEEYYTRRHLNSRTESEHYHLLPALAIPTTDTKTFVLPAEHFNQMCLMLQQATRILIIGWKAGDEHMLKLMRDTIKHSIPLYVVSGPSGTEEVRGVLKNAVPSLDFAGGLKEFSNFPDSELSDQFFKL